MGDPFGAVQDVMTECNADGSGCESATKDQLVKDIAEILEKYTGLPVVNSTGECIGVVSDKDVIFDSPIDLEKTVGEIMSSPAITCFPRTPITFAAARMLEKKVHRLPVVDK